MKKFDIIYDRERWIVTLPAAGENPEVIYRGWNIRTGRFSVDARLEDNFYVAQWEEVDVERERSTGVPGPYLRSAYLPVWAVDIAAQVGAEESRLREMDAGYPWGCAFVPEGYVLREVPASCGGEEHFSHSYCHPGWKERVRQYGGVVVADPVLTDSGWYALVAYPPETDFTELPWVVVGNPVEVD